MNRRTQDLAVDVVRGQSICRTHTVAAQPSEAAVNRRLAELGSGPNTHLRQAVVAALFPFIDNQFCCDEIGYMLERGDDADFILLCRRCEVVHGLTEHKPRKAPRQWSIASIDDYRSAAAIGAHQWVGDLPPGCDQPHVHQDCFSVHPFKIISSRCRLVAPQVLVYSNRHSGMPVTIVNDAGVDASSLYDTEGIGTPDWRFPFRLDSQLFPVIGTEQVINSLAAVDPDCLDWQESASLRGALEALWIRAPWPVDSALSTAAHDWIRPHIRDCAANNRCDLVDWHTFNGGRKGSEPTG